MSSRRLFTILCILSLAVGLVLVWIFFRPGYGLLTSPTERTRFQLYTELKEQFHNIPALDKTVLVHQRYYVCSKCLFAGTMALYATNLSWDTVQAFYRNYGANAGLECGGDSPGGLMHCQWSFGNASEEQQLNVGVNLGNSELWYSPVEASKKAIALGQTIYLIQIVHFRDKGIYNSLCPVEALNACASQWWETEIWPLGK
jgi:hypothetical protein